MPMRIVRAVARNPLTTVGLAGVALCGGWLIRDASEPAPWNPLGEYHVQAVAERVPGVDGPAAVLGAPLHVEGTKCNESGEPVEVTGTLRWQSIDPAGASGGHVTVNAVRSPGCVTRDFLNPVPPDVLRLMRAAIMARGGQPVVWAVTGEDTPLAPDGRRGVPRIWRTENFTIVPPGYVPSEVTP